MPLKGLTAKAPKARYTRHTYSSLINPALSASPPHRQARCVYVRVRPEARPCKADGRVIEH